MTQCDEIKHSFSYWKCIGNNSKFEIWWLIHISASIVEKIKLFCDEPFVFSDIHTTDSSNMLGFGVFLTDFWWLKVFKMCSEETESLSHLNDAPAFSVGYIRYLSALRHILIFNLNVHHGLIYIRVSFSRYIATIHGQRFHPCSVYEPRQNKTNKMCVRPV